MFLAAAADPNRSPLEFMLALMRDPQVPLEDRIDMAAAAAPFVHVRPEPVRKEAPDPLDLHNPSGERAETENLKFAGLDAKPNGHDGGGVSPLDFLLSVMGDLAASPRQRLRAAKIAARYKHAYGERAESASLVVAEDKFGFKVDAELARAERDDRLRESRLKGFKERSAEGIKAKSELERIAKRREERVAGVKFPDGYTYLDRKRDENRLGQLHGKRLARKRLTAEQEAEEAHLAVRVLNPKAVKPPVKLIDWREFELSMEWPTTRIAELDERVVGGETLTAEEEAERQDLRHRYPESAAEADRLDHLYRYSFRREMESGKKAGMDLGKAYDAAKQKCEGLRDATKIDRADLKSELVEKLHRFESFRFDEILTREEADELEELHRLYPQRAEKARNFVVRRLSYDKANRENTRRLGYDRGPIKQGEWPRIWTSPADDARSRTPGSHR